MKSILWSLTLIATLLTSIALCSCNKKETLDFDIPAEAIIVTNYGMEGSTSFDSSNITSITVSSIPTGWKLNKIDMYTSTITVTAPEFGEDVITSDTMTLIGYTPTGKTKTISILLAIKDPVDYYATPSNCYIAAEPDKLYIFNPMVDGCGNALNTARIGIIWQSYATTVTIQDKDVIKHLDMRDGKAQFYVGAIKEEDEEDVRVLAGNALIGAYDKDDNLIWSWHIWATNNDPRENTITLNGEEMMNINLGADCNSNGATDSDTIYGSYGLYYQWGRKEPFVGPATYHFSLNADAEMFGNDGFPMYIEYVESSALYGTTTWASSHPTSFITGYKENAHDWIYSGHETSWSAENNPCPTGWHIPEASVFANLTIATADDERTWEELQKMYGLHLVDTTTSEEYFFTAQGRRNYLDGRLDIINDDETLPVPWSAYYWTSTTDGERAKALYFDLNTATRTWNGFDASRSMRRANALPIRCVKDK